MTIQSTEVPEFTIAMRGYDRMQVADYMERLRHYAAELEDRLAQAEARAVAGDADLQTRDDETRRLQQHVQELTAEREASNPTAIGPRLERILALAEEEAAETRRLGEEEAATACTTAREQAAATLALARAEADELTAAATRDAESVNAQCLQPDASSGGQPDKKQRYQPTDQRSKSPFTRRNLG